MPLTGSVPGEKQHYKDLSNLDFAASEINEATVRARRAPFSADGRVQDLPRAVRQQLILGDGQRGWGPVDSRAYAERIEIRQDGCLIGDYPRCFGWCWTVYDPWRYVSVLVREPGALRNGTPFKDWVLSGALEKVRRKLKGVDDGGRQVIDILAVVPTEGLPALEAACAEAIAQASISPKSPQHLGTPPRSGVAAAATDFTRAAPCP